RTKSHIRDPSSRKLTNGTSIAFPIVNGSKSWIFPSHLWEAEPNFSRRRFGDSKAIILQCHRKSAKNERANPPIKYALSILSIMNNEIIPGSNEVQLPLLHFCITMLAHYSSLQENWEEAEDIEVSSELHSPNSIILVDDEHIPQSTPISDPAGKFIDKLHLTSKLRRISSIPELRNLTGNGGVTPFN